MCDTAGNRRSWNTPDNALADQDPCCETGSNRDGEQNRGQQKLSAGMRIPEKDRGFRKDRKQSSTQHTLGRIPPDQQHHQQADNAAGETDVNCLEGAKEKTCKNDFCNHQEHGALPAHQVDGIQEHSVGQAELDSRNHTAQ